MRHALLTAGDVALAKGGGEGQITGFLDDAERAGQAALARATQALAQLDARLPEVLRAPP